MQVDHLYVEQDRHGIWGEPKAWAFTPHISGPQVFSLNRIEDVRYHAWDMAAAASRIGWRMCWTDNGCPGPELRAIRKAEYLAKHITTGHES